MDRFSDEGIPCSGLCGGAGRRSGGGRHCSACASGCVRSGARGTSRAVCLFGECPRVLHLSLLSTCSHLLIVLRLGDVWFQC